jgi:uncharacterized protein (TIGR00106 family)
MLAEISVIPLDKGPRGLSEHIAQTIEVVKSSGLAHEVTALGTVIEGPPDLVFELARKCHEVVADKSERVLTTIRIDDQKGVSGQLKEKVSSVEDKLSA